MEEGIGNVKLKHGLVLAPMAGFSDRAMRLVSKECGAEYVVTEMVSAKAVVYGDKKTHKLAKIMADEAPCALQIFGSEPDIMGKAAMILSSGEEGGVAPSAIDINMGCPVKKVFMNGEGSALMKDPDLIYQIVKSVRNNTDIPCTVKMRAGIDDDHKNAVECALAAEAAGAALVAVHGRTRVEMYKGNADLEIIKSVRDSLKIPVIANGDIKDAKSAIYALRFTGAQGIMIGRGAIGNPFVFEEIKCALEGRAFVPKTTEERIDTALRQLRYAIEDKGESVAVREARGQIAFYIGGFRGAAATRAKINRALTYCDVECAMMEILENNAEEIL